MAIRDNKDYIRVLLHSHYTAITGRGVLLIDVALEPYPRPVDRQTFLGAVAVFVDDLKGFCRDGAGFCNLFQRNSGDRSIIRVPWG